MNIGQGKVFERPAGGAYLGTIIDVVDMPQVQTTYNGVTTLKDKVRVLWVLAYLNGQPYLDKEGQPFTIAGFYNATLTDNSNLTKALRQILSAQPPLLNNTEELERLLLGRSNQLFLTQEPDKKNPNTFATFVAGISPLPPGVVPPQAPAGFIRHKNKPKTQAGPQGRPVQTYAQAPAATPIVPQGTNVNLNAVPTASGPEAF